jgi:Tol biopolymer transport system component
VYTDVVEDFDVMDVPFNENPTRKMVGTSRREASAVWAPGAMQFAYLTDRSGPYEIWLKSTQEGWEHPIVRKGDFKDGIAGVMTSVAFSPDGGRIAYTRSLLDKYNIWISPVSGGSAVRLTDDDGTGQFGPTWSPDGNWIAFLQISGPSLKLVKSRVGGREAPTVLSEQLGEIEVSNPRWSPKGDWITLNTLKGFGLMSPDGKTFRELNTHTYQRNAWSKDGGMLYGMRMLNNETFLCSIDAQTGVEKVLRKFGSDMYFQEPVDIGQTFSLDPDGKGVLMTLKRSKTDIWMLEGFHNH